MKSFTNRMSGGEVFRVFSQFSIFVMHKQLLNMKGIGNDKDIKQTRIFSELRIYLEL